MAMRGFTCAPATWPLRATVPAVAARAKGTRARRTMRLRIMERSFSAIRCDSEFDLRAARPVDRTLFVTRRRVDQSVPAALPVLGSEEACGERFERGHELV